MWLAVAVAALTDLPVLSFIIITLDLPPFDFETTIRLAATARNDDLCEEEIGGRRVYTEIRKK